MSVIAQSYLIPLISGRHGRPATKLLSQENNKIFSSKLNVLQLKSRTFCVVRRYNRHIWDCWLKLPRQSDFESMDLYIRFWIFWTLLEFKLSEHTFLDVTRLKNGFQSKTTSFKFKQLESFQF